MSVHAPDARPTISAVVVTYRQRELLRRCLDSLNHALTFAGEPAEVIVVDNGEVGARDIVESASPGARLILTEENLGFAGGVQRGIDVARGEWILLVNDDIELQAPAVAELLAAGRSEAHVGSVAAQMRFAHDPGTVNSAGLEVDCLGVAADRFVGRPVHEAGTEVCDVFGASAGAALYRAAMLRDIGGFDTSFFAFLEDVDIAWRARMCGWSARHAPGAVVLHEHSATAGHGSAFKWRLVGRNRMRLLAKNATTRQLARHAPRLVAGDLMYVLFVAVRHRSLAPLSGRLAGLSDWRRYRRAGAAQRRAVALAPPLGLAAALRRNRAWRSGGASAPVDPSARGTMRNVVAELSRVWELCHDRRSRLRWGADILAYRLLRFVRLPGLARPRTIRLAGGVALTYRLNRGDVLTLREVWIDEVYRLPAGVTARGLVDLGANIGLTSVWFAARHGCSQIVAVEPLAENVVLLRRNLEMNGLAATVLQCAVGAAAGEARFAPAQEPNSGQLSAEGVPVAVLAMPTVLAQFAPDTSGHVLKVDIEGAERELFASDLSWLSRVDTILLEIHPPAADPEAISAVLDEAGFSPVPLPASADFADVRCFLRRPRHA